MKRVEIIGFSGTIASGKSSRCLHLVNVARQYPTPSGVRVGVQYVDADRVGHNIYLPGTPCYRELISYFGPSILCQPPPCFPKVTGLSVGPTPGKDAEEPCIDRRILSELVFSDSAKLHALNRICWPHIDVAIHQSLEVYQKEAAAARQAVLLVVLEAALLVEMDALLRRCKELWIVHCTPEEAVRRVQRRNNVDEEDAWRRVKSQRGLTDSCQRLRQMQYPGEVRIFDTTTETLPEGLRKLEGAFADYWAKHVTPCLEACSP